MINQHYNQPKSKLPSIPGGFAPSYRKELQSEVWLMPPIYHRVWYWIRMNAQHETFLFPTQGRFGIWVLPGQRITSLRDIASGVAWTEWGTEKVPNTKTISSILEWLKNRDMVTVESNGKGTLITVTNWHTYNANVCEKVTVESNAEGTANGHKEECKEGLEVKKESKTSYPKPIKPVSPDALRLSNMLAEMILTNNPSNRSVNNGKRDGTVNKWAVDIDKLIRIDKQPAADVERVIRWSQGDDFWKGNILSGSKLRTQWDSLTARITSAGNKLQESYQPATTTLTAEQIQSTMENRYAAT